MRSPLRALTLIMMTVVALAPQARAGSDRLAQVRRIAVISSLGDRADIALWGVTIFDSKGGFVPIAGWDLDGVATRQAVAMLAQRYQIVPVAYDPASFVPKDTEVPSPFNLPDLRPLIRELPALGRRCLPGDLQAGWYPAIQVGWFSMGSER